MNFDNMAISSPDYYYYKFFNFVPNVINLYTFR